MKTLDESEQAKYERGKRKLVERYSFLAQRHADMVQEVTQKKEAKKWSQDSFEYLELMSTVAVKQQQELKRCHVRAHEFFLKYFDNHTTTTIIQNLHHGFLVQYLTLTGMSEDEITEYFNQTPTKEK